ncbi:MAG: peptide-methionine (S)-S-oxide reductase MsrA [Burkholderiales bacterium]|nr:peptide-methionine (S)-S-oxide reductase MsrA [Burkholderiales bacterium]
MMYMIFKGIFWRFAFACMLLAPTLVQAQASKPATLPTTTAVATFGGGCFWCVEEAFDKVAGVVSTTSGYMGGRTKNPTYPQVSSGSTGHNEVVQVVYDPTKVSYAQLLDAFWRNIDPTQANGQFCDHGSQYRSEIFYHDDIQRKAAEASKAALLKNKPFAGDVHTLITRAAEFYPAEDYHQDYYRKNPIRYTYYKTSCGREARLKEVWKTR